MSISSMLFDVENIFFDGTAWHRWVHQQACSLGATVGYQSFLSNWQRDWLPNVYSGRQEYWTAMEDFLRGQSLNECQVLELVISARTRQREVIRNSRPLPGILSCLNSLKRNGTKLGVICNSVHTSQDFQVRLAELGIRIPFDVCLTSRSAGRQLPDPLAFEHVIRDLNVAAGATAYVTTSIERLDVARCLGLKTVHVETPNACVSKDSLLGPATTYQQSARPNADFRVTSIQEVFGIVCGGCAVGVPVTMSRTFHGLTQV